MKEIIREFKPTTFALKNTTTIFLLTILLAVAGIFSYTSLPKELYPEANFPIIMVKTIYPGNAPVDMENLVTRPIENEINPIKGIKLLRSTSTQDNSDIFVEFNTGIKIKDALQEVKDAVDKAKSNLPNDMPTDPMVFDIDFSEFPILNINLSGDFTPSELNGYADYLIDMIEAIPEISKVELTGLEDREVQVLVDPIKLELNELSFGDIENAIGAENVSMAGGSLLFNDNTRWAVRTEGEFTDVSQIAEIIVKDEGQKIVYLRDVARVEDTFADPLSFSRLNNQTVVTLQVVKKSGENLLSTTDKVFEVVERVRKEGGIPKDLNVTITMDQSEYIRSQISNLENSVIFAVILVVLVLYLFLGLKNALFVGLAIPLSMLMSFMIFGIVNIQINMIVLFSLILALGLLVDNSIVAVDNIFRFAGKDYSMFDAVKMAIGEIAMPIITSTATTLAAFAPLAFWGGMIGEFMKYLPITLIIVLTSSLFVSLVIIPVFSFYFFKNNPSEQQEGAGLSGSKGNRSSKIRLLVILGIMGVVGIAFKIAGLQLFGNILVIAAIVTTIGQFALKPLAGWFTDVLLPFNERLYKLAITNALKGRRPRYLIAATFAFLVVSILIFGIRQPKVLFFPDEEPQYVNILVEMPVETDIAQTNKVMMAIEEDVDKILVPYRQMVKSILTTVGRGSEGENEFMSGDLANRGRITINFVDFELRKRLSSSTVLEKLSDNLVGKYPGIEIQVVKNLSGPPTGPPINIEVSGPDFNQLTKLTNELQASIENGSIQGIEGLKSNLNDDKPEIVVHIDRDAARRFGVSTYSIASTIRTALFGKEVSKFKVGEEEFPVNLRLKEEYRNNLAALLNQRITFRNPSSGRIMQVPISAVASFEFSKTLNSVNRINTNRAITLSSNVLPGFNANQVNTQIKQLVNNFDLPEGYKLQFTGEQQEQAESMAFLIRAFLIAISIIMLILVGQFNSVYRPVIVMASVIFSLAGVFFGLAIFKMDFIIIMMGIGIVSLAGVVVNNAIVLIDYTDYLIKRRKAEVGISFLGVLDYKETLGCVMQAGQTRFRPVILTAITTMLGLAPMAFGLNFNFATLITQFDPQIYFGGENADFWSPLAWTVIFGLSAATFLTLIIIPSMYLVTYSAKRRIKEWFG